MWSLSGLAKEKLPGGTNRMNVTFSCDDGRTCGQGILIDASLDDSKVQAFIQNRLTDLQASDDACDALSDGEDAVTAMASPAIATSMKKVETSMAAPAENHVLISLQAAVQTVRQLQNAISLGLLSATDPSVTQAVEAARALYDPKYLGQF